MSAGAAGDAGDDGVVAFVTEAAEAGVAVVLMRCPPWRRGGREASILLPAATRLTHPRGKGQRCVVTCERVADASETFVVIVAARRTRQARAREYSSKRGENLPLIM